MRIEKKTLASFFQKVLDGEKRFELRVADFECKPGDVLVLREIDDETRQYTGRVLEKKVTFVLKTKGLKLFPEEDVEKFGYLVMSLD